MNIKDDSPNIKIKQSLPGYQSNYLRGNKQTDLLRLLSAHTHRCRMSNSAPSDLLEIPSEQTPRAVKDLKV